MTNIKKGLTWILIALVLVLGSFAGLGWLTSYVLGAFGLSLSWLEGAGLWFLLATILGMIKS